MISLFFPSFPFGLCFTAALLALLAAAAVIDVRTMLVPKRLVFVTLGAGAIATLLRGALLGASDQQVWCLAPGGVWIGLADAFLFALCGVLVGFFATFALWVLGVCGGGDVKLTAALGAWLGPTKLLVTLVVAVLVVVLFLAVRIAPAALQGNLGPGHKPKSRLVTFSLPLALAALVLLVSALNNDRLVADVARTLGVRGASN